VSQPRLPLVLVLAALAGLAPASPGASAPANDACETATAVPEEEANRFLDAGVDLPAATAVPGEPAGCVDDIDHTVWYRWTAPAEGALLVVTGCTPDFDAVANVYEAGCDAPLLVECGAGACAGGPQLAIAFVSAGEEYLVQVGTDASVAPGVMAVQLCFLGPEQDDADDDGIPDCIDACTDEDGDGFGDGPLAKRPLETCPEDNCEDVYNADQADRDLDGVGDACDEDEDRCELTLQEAADADWVVLRGKGCYSGDCIGITLLNSGGQGCVVKIRRGDVLVNRDEGEQDMGVTRDQDVYVPPGGEASLGGIYAACLEHEKDVPNTERLFDVTDNLASATGRENLAALLAVLQVPSAHSSSVQGAVWRLTDGEPSDPQSDALLVAAGLDPAALPSGGFPDLLNPNAGSEDPPAQHLAGLLAGPPGDCESAGAPEAIAACLLERLTAAANGLAPEEIQKRLRKKIVKRAAGVRAKVDAAAVETDPEELAKLRKRARSRAERLLGLLERAAAKGKLPAVEGQQLRDDAGAVVAALSGS
jgi:hypothetical protein